MPGPHSLVALSLLVWIASCCDNSITIFTVSYQCRYKVNYDQSDDCSHATFQKCDITAHDGSIAPMAFHLQAKCSIYCCQNELSFNMFCPELEPTTNYFVIVVISLSCFIFLFITAVFFYHLRGDCCFCCSMNCFRENNGVGNNNPSAVGELDTQSNLEPMEKKWEVDEQMTNKNECSVCLCEEANFMLPCGHMFHKACIFECFKRKYECILCRREEMTEFRLYCKRCLRRHIKIFFYELKMVAKDSHQTTCDACLRTQQLANDTTFS